MSRMPVNFFRDEMLAHAAIRRLHARRATIGYRVIYVPGGVRFEWNVQAPICGGYVYRVPFEYPMPRSKLRILQQRARKMARRPRAMNAMGWSGLPKKTQAEIRARGYDIQPRRPWPRRATTSHSPVHLTLHESTHSVLTHALGGAVDYLWVKWNGGWYDGEAGRDGSESTDRLYDKLHARQQENPKEGGGGNYKNRHRVRRKVWLTHALIDVAPFFAEIDLLGHIGWVKDDGFYVADQQFGRSWRNSTNDFQNFKETVRRLAKCWPQRKHKIDREQFLLRWARVLVWRHREVIRRVAATMLATPPVYGLDGADYRLSAGEFLWALRGDVADVMRERHIARSYQRNLEAAEAAGDYWGD